MEAENFKIKSHERSDKPKTIECNFTCTQAGPASIMKFSPQKVESPPPKPPRRRYSDQLSVPSLGTYSSNKKHEENQRGDSRLKIFSPKPAYLSLPANLTTNVLTESNDSFNLLSHSFNHSDQFKYFKENYFYPKYFLENLKFSDNNAKKTCSNNRFCYKEKLQSISQSVNNDYIFSKYQYNFGTYVPDKVLRSHISNSKTFMISNCSNHNFKSAHKYCHRRHHSDPAISHFNFQKDSVKSEWEQYYDSISNSVKKVTKYCDSLDNCSCCKKSYLIMQEIKVLKEINDKLWQHLCSVQSCLENMKKKTYDECMDVSVSGLLSSIYYAQKAKDFSMEERLKVVLKERDATLHELDDLIQVLTKSYDDSDGEKEMDKDMKELLGEIGCTVNPSTFLKYQRMLLAQIHCLKGSKQGCLSHKYKQATNERDNALEKSRKLEEEVKDLKTCYDLWHSDNKQWEVSMFGILNQVIHQRDTVLSKIENGFEISNVIYRSSMNNKLDSIEQQNVSPFEPRSKTIESLKSHQSIHFSDYKQQHSIGTSDEIRHLKEEILLLNKALESERKKREQSDGKCLRLERLIHILRKKLNGQNVGVPV